MYSGYVDYKGLRLAQFSESRLDRLQERVKKQYGLAKRAYKAAESQVILGETPGTDTLEAIGVRVKCLRILKEAVDAKSFLEATDVPAHGEAVAARHKAELDKALEALRLVEAVGLAEDDQDLGPVLKARRLKAAQAKRQYDGSSNLATYDAILRRQVQAAQALVGAVERLTDLVADNSQDEAAVAVAEAATNAAVAHWRQRRTASDKALNIVQTAYESSAHDSTMASSFEVVGRPTSVSTSASASFIGRPASASTTEPSSFAGRPPSASTSASASFLDRPRNGLAAGPSWDYAPEISGSPITAPSRSYVAVAPATVRPSSSAPGFGSRAEQVAPAPSGRSWPVSFFDSVATPVAMSTPLPGLDESGPIGDVPAAVSAPQPRVPRAMNAGNQARRGAVNVDASFHPVARQYQDMPLSEARRTVKTKRGEKPCRTLFVGRLRQEVDGPRLRQFFDQLGYNRIEKVRTGFGDSPYGDGKTHYYGWVTFAEQDQAEDCRYRWDGRSDWGLTPKDERRGGRRHLHLSFCNNTLYAPELVDHGDHGSDED